MIGNRTLRLSAVLVILSGFAPQTSAEDLGRLFFSADERRILNQKRSAPSQETSREAVPKPVANLEPAESVQLAPPKITGRVVRSSGNNTVWVNETPNYLRKSPVRQFRN